MKKDDDERIQIQIQIQVGLCCGAGQCSGRLRRNKQRRKRVNKAEGEDGRLKYY